MFEELFEKNKQITKEVKKLEEDFYKSTHNLQEQRNDVIQKIKELKLNELGISLNDKVYDTQYKNEAYLIDLHFRQKPHTFLKELDEISFDDYEFKGEFRTIKQDGSCGSKEPLGILRIENLKKI